MMATLADNRVETLVAAAKKAALDMTKAAGQTPGDGPVQIDARSFRQIAALLGTSSEQVRIQHEKLSACAAKLDRIANLQIRGATQLIEAGDWKQIVSELQAIAQDSLVGSRADRAANSRR